MTSLYRSKGLLFTFKSVRVFWLIKHLDDMGCEYIVKH